MPAFAKSSPLTFDNPASVGRFRLLTCRGIDGMEQVHVVVSRFKSFAASNGWQCWELPCPSPSSVLKEVRTGVMPVLTAFEPLAPQDPPAIGVFRLRARLGSGGMGRVYLGFSLAGRAVAVKVVHPELARDEAFRRRFRREVAAARRVSGAYTAPVIDAGPDDEIPWLATAYVAGPSVADAVVAAGPLPPDSVLRLGGGLAEALADIHATDVVHRDLKPSNVLLAADGPRVIDFGISRALGTTAMTTANLVIGTPAFMSPEQATGTEAGYASDIFSLGATLAYAATGRVPFGEGSSVTVLYRTVHAEPDLDGLGGPLRDLIARCLAKDPAARPTVREVAALACLPIEDSKGSEDTDSFWPAALDDLIRSHTDRAAGVPVRLADTMTVQRAVGTKEPTDHADAVAGQSAVEDVPADPGVSADGDALLPAANGGSAALAGSYPVESVPQVLAGVPSADGTELPATVADVLNADAPGADGVSGNPGKPSGRGPGALTSGVGGGAARPARTRRPMLSRGALAAALVVVLAACVAAAVTLLPSEPEVSRALAHGFAWLGRGGLECRRVGADWGDGRKRGQERLAAVGR